VKVQPVSESRLAVRFRAGASSQKNRETHMTWFIIVAVCAGLYIYFRSGGGKASGTAAGSIKGPGNFEFDIVGESNYQKALRAIAGPKGEQSKRYPCVAVLVLEDDNQYDKNAVRVDIDGQTVGYLDRKMAKQYRAELDRQRVGHKNLLAQALIVGGWSRDGGDTGSYGVKLDLPLND
jgi:hypothetical protein